VTRVRSFLVGGGLTITRVLGGPVSVRCTARPAQVAELLHHVDPSPFGRRRRVRGQYFAPVFPDGRGLKNITGLTYAAALSVPAKLAPARALPAVLPLIGGTTPQDRGRCPSSGRSPPGAVQATRRSIFGGARATSDQRTAAFETKFGPWPQGSGARRPSRRRHDFRDEAGRPEGTSTPGVQWHGPAATPAMYWGSDRSEMNKGEGRPVVPGAFPPLGACSSYVHERGATATISHGGRRRASTSECEIGIPTHQPLCRAKLAAVSGRLACDPVGG